MIRICLLLLALIGPTQASAESVVAGLSQNEIAITANFDGSDLLIYGAVKRDAQSVTDPIDVIITVSGPAAPVTVRKKQRRFGIWVNTDSADIDLAPSYYSIATTAPLSEILSETENLRHRIDIPQAIRLVGEANKVDDPEEFSEALIRIRRKEGLYQENSNTVTLAENTLFSTSIDLPSNLVEGPYTTRIFLLRDTEVIDRHDIVIDVNKVGMERWIYDLAHNQPLAYGLLSIFIAIAAGWAASAFFRLIRF